MADGILLFVECKIKIKRNWTLESTVAVQLTAAFLSGPFLYQ
jgi:hypothetical protein